MLGNPEYIQILVDPNRCLIAIRRYHKYTKDVLKVEYGKDGEFDYYSNPLLDRLSGLIENVDKTRTYRIEGNPYKDEVISFDMKDAVLVELQDNEERE